MSKEPAACGKSVSFYGVYLCKLEVTPCANVESCPAHLFKVEKEEE